MDKEVRSPDIYTHHDNAMASLVDIKARIGGTHLSPNRHFDNVPVRDNSMYQISDLTNLNHGRYVKWKNSLDRYLEIENILPH